MEFSHPDPSLPQVSECSWLRTGIKHLENLGPEGNRLLRRLKTCGPSQNARSLLSAPSDEPRDARIVACVESCVGTNRPTATRTRSPNLPHLQRLLSPQGPSAVKTGDAELGSAATCSVPDAVAIVKEAINKNKQLIGSLENGKEEASDAEV